MHVDCFLVSNARLSQNYCLQSALLYSFRSVAVVRGDQGATPLVRTVPGGRHLGFVRIGNSVIRSAVHENPTLEPNMKWIGSPVAEIWPFAYVGGIWNPHFGGRGGRTGSAMAPLERAMAVSYRLSIVTVALSATIRPQFAIECL